MREALSLGTWTIFTLRGEAPPCGATPAAPRWAAASYCDRSPSQRPARQIFRSRAFSTPEPELRPRRYHGASFLPAPSHGPRHKTTAALPELTESANASGAPSSPPPRPNRPGRRTAPHRCTRKGFLFQRKEGRTTPSFPLPPPPAPAVGPGHAQEGGGGSSSPAEGTFLALWRRGAQSVSLLCPGSWFLQALQEAESCSPSPLPEEPLAFCGPRARSAPPGLRPPQPSALCPRRWMA